jgi:hypothetical protein
MKGDSAAPKTAEPRIINPAALAARYRGLNKGNKCDPEHVIPWRLHRRGRMCCFFGGFRLVGGQMDGERFPAW